MHIAMIKKRLLSGEPCRKCAQAEELLRSRGLWERIDEVIVADEADPASPGMKEAARVGAKLAPFFVVTGDDGKETIYESTLQLIRDRLSSPAPATAAPTPAPASPTNTSPGSTGSTDELDPAEIENAARDLASRPPAEILRYGIARWGASLGIAFSGAEDVVLVHMASEMGLPFSVFCLDTGRLHPETYRFIDEVRKRYGLEIALMSPEAPAVEALVRKKGLFSFYEDGHEECCGVRKVAPLRRALSGLRAWATGQRRDQSPSTRSAIAVLERDRTFHGVGGGALVKLNPLAAWTSAQVWQYIRENDVPHNALHERGFVSIGCEPCTRAVMPGEHERAGRWWWEESTKRECGLHIGNVNGR